MIFDDKNLRMKVKENKSTDFYKVVSEIYALKRSLASRVRFKKAVSKILDSELYDLHNQDDHTLTDFDKYYDETLDEIAAFISRGFEDIRSRDSRTGTGRFKN